MYKRFIIALIVILSMPILVWAEDLPGEEALKSIDDMLDTLSMDVLYAESEDEFISGDIIPSQSHSDSGDIASYSSYVGSNNGYPISGDAEPDTIIDKGEPSDPSSRTDTIRPVIIPIPEPESEDHTEHEDVPSSVDITSASADETEHENVPVSVDITPASADKTEHEEPVSADNPPSSTKQTQTKGTPAPVQESHVTPKEFLMMCREAPAVLILNAIENRNADVNYADSYGVTPVMAAAENNPFPEVIEILADAGADINASDNGGETALMYAAASNPNPEIISALAGKGAQVNARNKTRRTPLMYAARKNNADVVKALIDAGAEELADANGWTPLFWAARYTQYPEVIAILLDAGHNPKAHSYDMAKPIEHANMNPNLMNTDELLRLEKESR